MLYYYGDKNILRALDEAEFWKRQEEEHTEVVQAVTPDLEQSYVQVLQQFGQEFAKTYGELVKYVESVVRSRGMFNNEIKADICNLINESLYQSQQFVEFLQDMLMQSQAVRQNPTSQAVIKHVIRESQYFIGIDQLIL